MAKAKTLEEYAAQHSLPEPTAAPADTTGRVYRDQQDRQQARQLMDSIQAQLQEGTGPQYILYTAIKAIGLLSHDAAWEDAARASLDFVYGDLMQKSMLIDQEAIAAQRLAEMQTNYNEKTKKQLQGRLADYDRLAKKMREALQVLEEITGADAAPEDQ